jgi:hypothetical protein
MFCFIANEPNSISRARCEFHLQFCGQILADFEQKGPRNFNKIVSIILSNSREVPKKYYYFPTHTDKDSIFLKPKFLLEGKITGGPIFFPQRPIFSYGFADMFCKELASLAKQSLILSLANLGPAPSGKLTGPYVNPLNSKKAYYYFLVPLVQKGKTGVGYLLFRMKSDSGSGS